MQKLWVLETRLARLITRTVTTVVAELHAVFVEHILVWRDLTQRVGTSEETRRLSTLFGSECTEMFSLGFFTQSVALRLHLSVSVLR